MKKRGIIFVTIGILIIAIALFIILKNRGDNNAQECERDSDCIKQQIGCCSCAMGGEERCISKKDASYWQGKLSECDGNIFCTAMYNCDDNPCRCVDGKCEQP